MVGIKPFTIIKMLQPLRNQRFDNNVPGNPPQTFVISFATYSPWLADVEFMEDDAEAGRHSLVDIYRRYELAQLVRQTSKVPGDILEVGVYRGGTGCLMALAAQRCRKDFTVFLCDTYAGVVKAGDKDIGWKGGEFANTSVEMVENLIKLTGAPNTKILRGIFPDETAGEISDRKFSLCHIDVDVYQSAKDVFEWVWPRLSVGGVVIFDDYGMKGTTGITKFANECASLPQSVFVYNINGHGLIIKTS